MTTSTSDEEKAARRAAVPGILARYPDTTPEEERSVLRYLRKEASAMDRATIASDRDTMAQYRQLCRDHHLDRLRPLEYVLLALGLTALVLVFYVLAALARTI